MHFHYLLISISALLLVGCINNPDIQQITQDPAYAQQRDGRYINTYSDIDYPPACTTDCYEPHPWVTCEEPGENCKYTGKLFIGHGEDPANNTGFFVRWLGHASFKIEAPNGELFLFDPVSGQFDWPINWAFRLSSGFFRTPGDWLETEQKEAIQAVLYSHIHYDHFSKSDIRRLGTTPDYFVPLNVGRHFPRGNYQVHEMDWFTSYQSGDVTIHAVPAHHFSSRKLVPFLYEDHNRDLWGAWILEYNGKTLFFAGDTGYSEHFNDIHAQFGDIDICLIPIASYHHDERADWYRYVHTNPEDAFQAAQDLKCKAMIPWGYGNASWQMGDHSSHSPLIRMLNTYPDYGQNIPLYILNEGDGVRL